MHCNRGNQRLELTVLTRTRAEGRAGRHFTDTILQFTKRCPAKQDRSTYLLQLFSLKSRDQGALPQYPIQAPDAAAPDFNISVPNLSKRRDCLYSCGPNL